MTRGVSYPVGSGAERSFHLSRTLLDWEPLLAPFIEAAGHIHHISVTHRLERLSRQRRAPTRGTRYNDVSIPLRREFWFGIGRCRVGIPL